MHTRRGYFQFAIGKRNKNKDIPMKQLTDKLLIEFNLGDQEAFHTIFESFRMRIYYFVKNLIGDQPVAEEITSDTFVKLYRLHDRFQTYNNIQAFLYIAARNASLDFLKYRQRQRQNMTEFTSREVQRIEFPSFAETNIEAELLDAIYNKIEQLPQRCREIFKLAYLEGRSVSEIAKIMKLKPQTVANQKQIALKALRIFLSERELCMFFLVPLLGKTADQ
jgi:RNA polymerase sigma-70 factor (family 1)